MNKADLVEVVAARIDTSKKDAAEAVQAVVDAITEAVARGQKVSISGFGVFEKAARPARTYRKPSTGEAISKVATAVPKFRPGGDFRALVAGEKTLSEAVRFATDAVDEAVRRVTGRKPAAAKPAAAKPAAAKSAPAATADAAPAKKSPAKKAAAKKTAAAPAKKAPAKRAAAKTTASAPAEASGAAAPAKRAVKKAPAKRSTAATAPAKKTTTRARKAPAKSAPASPEPAAAATVNAPAEAPSE